MNNWIGSVQPFVPTFNRIKETRRRGVESFCESFSPSSLTSFSYLLCNRTGESMTRSVRSVQLAWTISATPKDCLRFRCLQPLQLSNILLFFRSGGIWGISHFLALGCLAGLQRKSIHLSMHSLSVKYLLALLMLNMLSHSGEEIRCWRRYSSRTEKVV